MENIRYALTPSAKRVFAICLLSLGLAACHRTEPIHNVEDRVVPVQSNSPRSSKIIGDAIIRAAAASDWLLALVEPGQYRATTTWRSHTATAIITYNEQSYSISLDQSQNLLQSDGQIHRAYNRRVKRLEAEIDRQLLLAAR